MRGKSFLRIVPMSGGLLLPIDKIGEYRAAVEEFPAYGPVLLRLASLSVTRGQP